MHGVSEEVSREARDRVKSITGCDRERAQIDGHRQCARARRGGTRDAGAAQGSGDAGLRMELERRVCEINVVDVAGFDRLSGRVTWIVAVGNIEMIAPFSATIRWTRCRPELGSPTSASRGVA